jgi:hypothetical protein
MKSLKEDPVFLLFKESCVNLHVAHGDDSLQIWKISAKILNKYFRTAENGWS